MAAADLGQLQTDTRHREVGALGLGCTLRSRTGRRGLQLRKEALPCQSTAESSGSKLWEGPRGTFTERFLETLYGSTSENGPET